MRLRKAAPSSLNAVMFYYDAVVSMNDEERAAFDWWLQFGQTVGVA